MAQRVFRINELTTSKERRGRYPISPATWWRWVADGKAPKGFKLGPNTTVWSENTLDKWDADKAAGGQQA
jgi:predicted DNA-binding transcriptional regulator AlpA